MLWRGALSLGGWEHGREGGDEIPPLRPPLADSGRNDTVVGRRRGPVEMTGGGGVGRAGGGGLEVEGGG